MNLFDIHGPMFLYIYITFFALALVGARMSYDQALTVADSESKPRLDPYEVAYLSGGSARVFLTALTTLSHANFLEIHDTSKSVKVKSDDNPADPFERALLDLCRQEPSVDKLYEKVQALLSPARQKLTAMNLLATEEQVNNGKKSTFWILISLVLFVGMFQLVSGYVNHKPVGFLTVLVTMNALAAFHSTVRVC